MPLLRDSDFQCRSVRVQRDAWETERRVRKLGRVLYRDHCVPGMRQGGCVGMWWPGYLSCVLSVTVINNMTPNNLLRKGFISSTKF